MLSSVSNLIDVLKEQIPQGIYQKQPNKYTQEQTIQQIIEKLNVEGYFQEKLEGSLRLDWVGSKRYYAFDNNTVEVLAEEAKELLGKLKSGYNFAYQKMHNDLEVTIAIPTASGLPFVYTYKTPSVVSVSGNMKIRQNVEQKPGQSQWLCAALSTNMEVVYSTRLQARLTIVTPFDHQQYVAGHDRNIQAILPIHGEIDVDTLTQRVQVQLKPSESHARRLLHYSSWPYTSQQSILSIQPLAEEKNTLYIHKRKPLTFETILGDETTGVAFRVKAQTEKKRMDLKTIYEVMEHQNFISILALPATDIGLEQTSFDLFYEPESSSAKTITFTASYANGKELKYEQSSEEQDTSSNSALPSAKEVNSKVRRTEFLRKVQSGIKEATGHVVDLGLEIQGQHKTAQFVATVAAAKSPVAIKSRVLVYLRKSVPEQKNFELAFDGSARVPFTPISSVQHALRDESKVEVRAKLNYGEQASNGAHIYVTGKFEQSDDYRQYFERQQQARNLLLSGQQLTEAIKYADVLDHHTWTVEYQKVGPVAKNMTYQVYSILRHLAYPYMSENPLPEISQQQSATIQTQLWISPDMETLNVTIKAPVGNTLFQNIRPSIFVAEILAVNPMQSPLQRLGKVILSQKYDGKFYTYLLTVVENGSYKYHK